MIQKFICMKSYFGEIGHAILIQNNADGYFECVLNHLFDFLVSVQASIPLLFCVCLELSIFLKSFKFFFSIFLVLVFQIVSIWMYKSWVFILCIWFFWRMCTDFCQFQFLWWYNFFGVCVYLEASIFVCI